MSDTEGLDQVEQWLMKAWHDVGLPHADPESDFFEAGGTSLTAMKLIAKVEEEFGEDALPPDDLFEKSTLAEIARCIHGNRAALPTSGG